jgi:predicted enzyme related to lactoylglutathione lyase
MTTVPNGKICYLEIPAADVDASSGFYTKVFGWKVRDRGNGDRAFDDSTGAVSGTWVLGRSPSREPGMLTYVMVDDIAATLQNVVAAGGQTVTSFTPLSPGGEGFATFLDPAGNLLGLYQERRR